MAKFEQPLGRVEEIPEEGSVKVDFFGRNVHLVKARGGVPAAFLDVCMHLGGPLRCEEGGFQCEWHGATFDAATGRRQSGPAAERSQLMRLPTVVRDGVVIYVWGADETSETNV